MTFTTDELAVIRRDGFPKGWDHSTIWARHPVLVDNGRGQSMAMYRVLQELRRSLVLAALEAA